MGIFGNTFSGWHLILILAVILLLFGAAKLPGLAKSVGESVRILRSETKETKTTKDIEGASTIAPDAEHPEQSRPGPYPAP
ncbi:twin-arginine translocase TatA/TatE family subunit [uncultured Microbacterium sp.]|uniref:twin-arginine translocase TatA/TatE family subunit n=1 Tax=uncultured Microbacterium sp. TaxID=191216 RepID=UPI0025CC548A|nr:twin-arginine translocase TatA/TatE family subunit [uncultured Microbacterium sp.]